MTETLASALEREHHEIDAGIAAFRSSREIDELRDAVAALRRHIYLEEVLVFPSLRGAGLTAPVFVMLREHGEMWRLLDRMDATDEPGALGDMCAELVPTLEAHNGKEEPILYPQVDGVLDDDLSAVLREFLEAGEMPAGWTCEQATGQPRNLPFG
jgi:iron-sulfur cluster repair protein YtfE (RIC family)